MKLKQTLGIATVLSLGLATSSVALANDAVIGALIGGTAGAFVGRSMGGRDAAVAGGVIGAAAGAAIATQPRTYHQPRATYYPSQQAYYAPPPAYHVRQPGYYPPQQVYYAPPAIQVRGDRYYYDDNFRHHDRRYRW